jgi:hypothetical protein
LREFWMHSSNRICFMHIIYYIRCTPH